MLGLSAPKYANEVASITTGEELVPPKTAEEEEEEEDRSTRIKIKRLLTASTPAAVIRDVANDAMALGRMG